MEHLKIKVINKSNNELPAYETFSSAGMDIRAFLAQPIVIEPMQRALIPTGLYVQLPHGYELQVRPRSGLALKKGITVLNTPGTVDADYRGEIGIILINTSAEPFEVNSGDRVAQIVINEYSRCDWELTDSLDETERGAGGFGHTGVQ